jgi:MFS family permease
MTNENKTNPNQNATEYNNNDIKIDNYTVNANTTVNANANANVNSNAYENKNENENENENENVNENENEFQYVHNNNNNNNDDDDDDDEQVINDIEKHEEVRVVINREIAPMDEGYSWVICGCCFILNCTTWGMNSGFLIYLSHFIIYDTFPGMTKVDYSYIGGIAFGAGILFSPLLIILYNYIGIKPMITLGNCLQFTALMLASFAVNKWQIYCSQGLLQGFGLATLSIPTMTLIPQYFIKRRVLASSLANAGSGLGGIIFNLAMQKVIQQRSVFWAIRAQAITAFGLISIVTIFIRSKTPRKSSSIKVSDDLIVYIQKDFYLLALFLIFCIFGYVIVLYTLAKFTTSMGYTDYQGSIVSAMVQLGSLIGRPIVGQFGDKIGPVTVSSICYLLCGILCFAMWVPARSLGVMVVFALFEGAMMGSVYGMLSPVLQRVYGQKKLLSIFSKLWMIVGVAAIFSPVIGIKLTSDSVATVDPTSFLHCSIFAGCSFVGASLFLLLLRGHINAREHKIHESNQYAQGDLTPITTHLSISLFEILTYCFQRPIKIKTEKLIVNQSEGSSGSVHKSITEFKSAVI